MRRQDRQLMRDCKVILGEAVISQHRVLVMDMLVQAQHQKGQNIRKKERTSTWKLKRDIGLSDAYKLEVQARLAGTEEMTWDRLKNSILEAAKKVYNIHSFILVISIAPL